MCPPRHIFGTARGAAPPARPPAATVTNVTVAYRSVAVVRARGEVVPDRVRFVLLASLLAVRLAGAAVTERVAPVPDGASLVGLASTQALAMTADGRRVVFVLGVATDAGKPTARVVAHVYVRDRVAGTLEPADVAADGTLGDADVAIGRSDVAITPDGRFVVFASAAANLVPGDTNGVPDVFVHDFATGTTERISVSDGGGQADGASGGAAICDDGGRVAFWSAATNLASPSHGSAATPDVYVRDRAGGGATTRVSVRTDRSVGNGAALHAVSFSGDGRFVLFGYDGDDLDPASAFPGNLYLHDLGLGTTRVVGNGSDVFVLAGGGRFVAFASAAPDLVPGDDNGIWDVFVRDTAAAVFERASVASGGAEATGGSAVPCPAISADGRFVAFTSDANGLVAGDGDGATDVFLRDRQGGTTVRVDIASDGTPANGAAAPAIAVSDDGQCVAFITTATNLDPCAATGGAFVHCTSGTATAAPCAATTTTLATGGSDVIAEELSKLGALPSSSGFAASLAKQVARLEALVGQARAAGTPRKKQRVRLAKSVRLAGTVAHRLRSRAATKALDAGTLASLRGAADRLRADLLALRATV